MIAATRTDNGITIIELKGPRLDALEAPSFRQGVLQVVGKGANRLLLDMQKVDFVDSTGIGALVSVLKSLGNSGELALAGLNPAVQRAFALTRMNRVFPIYASAEEAVAQLTA